MKKTKSMVERHDSMVVKGIHHFTLERYSLWKEFSKEKYIDSNSFTVGPHQMVVSVFLNKKRFCSYHELDLYYIGLHITLKGDDDGLCCFLQMKLLDQSGKNKHLSQSWLIKKHPIVINPGEPLGYACFIERDDCEKSSYLKDDCLKIECTVGLVLPVITPSIAAGPRCDGVGVDFLSMLDSGEGSDVVFRVKREKFRAHKFILSARSSVLRSLFVGRIVSNQQEVFIPSTEPRVFKAILHFIYSDTLPQDERSLVVKGYAFGPSVSSTFGAKLLAAANQFDLKRLKRICEAHLWRSISLGRFAETLFVAERCNAFVLKKLCFKFADANYAILVELNKFSFLKENCPLLLKEVDDYVEKERLSLHLKKMKIENSSSNLLRT